MVRLRDGFGTHLAEHTGWQEQDALDKRQHCAKADADQFQRDREQPDDGPEHQRQQRQRPAQHEKNAPDDQGQKCCHRLMNDVPRR